MRIAHLTPTFFSEASVIGGGERYVYNLVKAIHFAAANYKLSVDQSVISIGRESKRFRHEGVDVRLLKNSSPSANNMDGISECLWTALDEFDLVHIHQNLTLFGAYATAVARSKAIPIVSTDLGGGDNPCMLIGRGLELSDGVISISEYAKSLIRGHFSGSHDVLIGPVDTAFFKPKENGRRDKKTAICVSRLLPHKGIDRVIAALPREMHLVIVGQVYDAKYFKLLKKLSKGRSVQFVHNADDQRLLSFYQSSGVFVQASTHKDCYGNVVHKPELMGLTTLEAMSCGLPAIVSDAGSLPELVPDPQFGRVFSTHDELHQALLDFSSGFWPIEQIDDLAREYVVSNFSFQTVGESLIAFYKETLGFVPNKPVCVNL